MLVNKSRVRSALTTLKKAGFIKDQVSLHSESETARITVDIPFELTQPKQKLKRKKC